MHSYDCCDSVVEVSIYPSPPTHKSCLLHEPHKMSEKGKGFFHGLRDTTGAGQYAIDKRAHLASKRKYKDGGEL